MTVKSYLSGKINTFYLLTRAYSLPISIMSWLIPFIFALFNNGNLFFGIISLLGIIILHLAVNLLDDVIDYSRELFDIKKGKKSVFNFQKGKCICFFENKITLKQAFLLDFILLAIVFTIALFFLFIFGTKLLAIIIPSAILCLSYPVLGCLGFGEIIVGLVFSPLLYSGVYFCMTGNFSAQILILSISTGLLTIAVLFNHSLLDYKYDTTNRKITLCRICKSEKSALILLSIIITSAYLNLLFWILNGNLTPIYILPFLTLPLGFKLIKKMDEYIKEDKVPDNADFFLDKFMLAQNLQKYFIIILCLSVILANGFKI